MYFLSLFEFSYFSNDMKKNKDIFACIVGFSKCPYYNNYQGVFELKEMQRNVIVYVIHTG